MTTDDPPTDTATVGRGWRLLFLAAGLFNVAGGVFGSLDPARLWTEAGMAVPIYDFPLRLLWAMVFVLGVGYLMVWRQPLRHRGLVTIGLLSKILGLGFTYWAIADGQLPASSWPMPLVADLPWALGFAAFLWRFRTEG